MEYAVRFLYCTLIAIYHWLESSILAFVPKRFRCKKIAGEIALVTGGGSGLGRLLCLRFASFGAKIVVWDLNLETARITADLIKERGGEAYAYQCDVSKSQTVYDAAAKVKREVGQVTILVNNAGIVWGKRLLDIPDDMIKKTFEVNAMAHFWTCKAFLPDMMANNHGHIVSICSIAGVFGQARLTDYCASKFAAFGFEESLRFELFSEGYTGIKSTVVCPYFINTGMFEGVNTGLYSLLTPEYVADEIVSGVLVNQEVIVIPKSFNLFLFLKAISSGKSAKFASEILEHKQMDGFSGRNRTKIN